MPLHRQNELADSDVWVEMQAMHPGELHHTNELAGSGEHSTRTLTGSKLDKRTVSKLDYILLPFVSLLFCLNSLDKTNIGNAETAGYTKDAGLDKGDINLAMACFFAVFVGLQPLGAALGRRFGMTRWVPACMSLWGLCTILHIWVSSRWQLVLLRIVIAALEAGFYPTTISYLSLFYTRYEFALRVGIFYGQAAVSGALGGVLSWAVFSAWSSKPDSSSADSGVKPWQVLFLVEGCLTLVVAVIGFIWLPHSAGSAWFLNGAQRSWAERRIVLDREHMIKDNAQAALPDDSTDGAHERLLGEQEQLPPETMPAHYSLTEDSGLHRHDILSALLQWKIWYLLACNILSAIPATAFGIFLPLIIKQMSPDLDVSPAATNLLAVPPFAFGAIVLLVFTYWSDRIQRRLLPILVGLCILILGLSITVWIPPSNLQFRYVGLCILLGGSFIASPLTVAWISNNTPEPGKRAILLGINGWGNLAGVSSVLLFTPEDAHNGYSFSFIVTLICVATSFLGYSFFMQFVKQENASRDSLVAGWSEDKQRREAQYGDVELPPGLLHRAARAVGLDSIRRGDDRLTYRYTY